MNTKHKLAQIFVILTMAYSVSLPLAFGTTMLGIPFPLSTDWAFGNALQSVVVSLIVVYLNGKFQLRYLGMRPALFRLLLAGGPVMAGIAIAAWCVLLFNPVN